MMYVMKSNIGCEPLEQWRKQKQTGTFQSAPNRAPAMAGVGVAVFKYVLHIKNVDKATSCYTNYDAIKTKEYSKSKPPSKTNNSGHANKVAQA